jgi:hypothetical protein
VAARRTIHANLAALKRKALTFARGGTGHFEPAFVANADKGNATGNWRFGYAGAIFRT